MKGMLEFAKPALWLILPVLLLFSSPLRSCFTPFLLALLLALAVREPIARLERHMPRWLASLMILTLVGLLGLCALALAAVQLWETVPVLTARFQTGLPLWDRLNALAQRLPAFLRSGGLRLLQILEEQSARLAEDWSLKLTEWGAGLVRALPGKLFTFCVTLLATYYAASDWHRLRRSLLLLLPKQLQAKAPELAVRLKEGAMGWLKAQGVLMALSFLILLAGFFLLGIPGAVIAALLIAAADALPFLGTGLILLPWAALSLLQGNGAQAAGLAVIWLIATFTRTALEPRLLGKEAGVSPLLTLFVLYAGLKLVGVAGLICAPVLLSAGMAVLRGEESP